MTLCSDSEPGTLFYHTGAVTTVLNNFLQELSNKEPIFHQNKHFSTWKAWKTWKNNWKNHLGGLNFRAKNTYFCPIGGPTYRSFHQPHLMQLTKTTCATWIFESRCILGPCTQERYNDYSTTQSRSYSQFTTPLSTAKGRTSRNSPIFARSEVRLSGGSTSS